MANNLDSNLRLGDRSEYLGQFFLSALGVSVLVPRPEDIGLDFMCSLQKKIGRRLSFHSPFNVQMGSTGEDGATKKFTYGGVTDPKDPAKRIHRDWEIEFLSNQHLPFFVGTVDKGALRFRLYSTSAMWFILHRVGRIGSIELCPDLKTDPLRESLVGEVDAPGGKLPAYNIPLGDPVIDLTVEQLATDEFLHACEALEYAVKMEQRNLIYRSLGTCYSLRLLDHTPNRPGAGFNYSYVCNAANVSSSLEWLKPICVTLAIALRGDADMTARLRGFVEVLPLDGEDRKVLKEHAGW